MRKGVVCGTVTFERLTSTTEAEFYHEFVANADRDPTGYATLKRVLGEADMQAFKQKWEKFVLGLRSS